MPSPLTIPGVQVRTLFEPAPVLPGATGILGLAGVTDRGPTAPTMVGSFGEFIDLFGSASAYTMPEARTAFANGVAMLVVARTQPGRGQKATLELTDDEGEKVVVLEARAEGEWANKIGVRIAQVKTLGGLGVKCVDIELALDGQVIETLSNLVMDSDSPDYLFDRINQGSKLVVATDPLFGKGLPVALAKTAFTDADARAASLRLKSGAADVVTVAAKRVGKAGNQIAVRVLDGRAGIILKGAADAPSLEIKARVTGAAGTAIRVAVQVADPDSINLAVTSSATRLLGPFKTSAEVVSALATDPDLEAKALGPVLPSVLAATPLAARVSIVVSADGRDPASYADLPDLAAVAAISDGLVTFGAVTGATSLPDATLGAPLTGGRNKGAALLLVGDTSDEPLLELSPIGPGGVRAVAIERAISTLDNTTGVVNLSVYIDDELAETFANLTMDPDDPNYLPTVLESSQFLRAHDLFVRSLTTSFPRAQVRPAPLKGGTSPLVDDYQDALDRLEQAEEVDLVIASVGNQLADADVRSVHKAVAAHCEKMGAVARNRIGFGSATTSESAAVDAILDHANGVRSDAFTLVAPAGAEAALCGLLGLQDYFESPTFKTVAALPVEPGHYTDAQLTQLINGNVLVINDRRQVGTIVVKGLLTSGRQINVQRTVNKAVRDVKAISDKYIGLLNNEGVRNALRQQIFALLLQMERDGALVPSTDGKDPSFKVDVYSTEADFANGIVRVDLAVRPVRAIDYIYATILVKN
jgi:hypothetical protein